MTVALYGGSFDPPHLGHAMVVSHLLLNDPSIESVRVVPCFKQTGKNLTAFKHRFRMCNKAFGWMNRVLVSDVERRLGGESYTIDLVRHLVAAEPKTKFRWVMGSDLQEAAKTWDGWDEVERLAPPLLVGRAGIAPLQVGDPTPICPAVSSTLIREALRRRDYKEAERYLAKPVLSVIQLHGLYRAP